MLAGAQAQKLVTKMVVKYADNTETKVPVSDVREVSFVEEEVPTFTPKPFSVSATKKVCFSGGNLQYQASTGTYRFATYQYVVVGSDNRNISSTYTGWIDLFGWGTGNNPAKSSQTQTDYSTFTDWGSKVNDGNDWFTLSHNEWEYFYKNHQRKWMTVHDVPGEVFLPDDAEVDLTASWEDMEAAGAVFLPAVGYRYGTELYYSGSRGFYWSSTSGLNNYAGYLVFTSSSVNFEEGNRSSGRSVRLVRLAQ